jgi:transketolase
MVYEGLVAAQKLAECGIDAMVINLHTIKPIDRDAIIEAAKKCRAVVTAEEHQLMGGMGGAVAEVLSTGYPVPVRMVGIRDRFGQSGDPDTLMREYGLTSDDIAAAAKDLLQNR